jgi:hypothetical protein
MPPRPSLRQSSSHARLPVFFATLPVAVTNFVFIRTAEAVHSIVKIADVLTIIFLNSVLRRFLGDFYLYLSTLVRHAESDYLPSKRLSKSAFASYLIRIISG